MCCAVLCRVSSAPPAIFVQWCLPWLNTARISRLVLLNTGLPPHPLFRELGLANAVLITIWQLAVMIMGRYMQVGMVCMTHKLFKTNGMLCSCRATGRSTALNPGCLHTWAPHPLFSLV